MQNKVTLQNNLVKVSTDLHGGAITEFSFLHGNQTNPLSFSFTKEQMPANNRMGAVYQGHFICLPRWGEPTETQIQQGFPNHGHFANMYWTAEKKSKHFLHMHAQSNMEEIQVNRVIELNKDVALFTVCESIINKSASGKNLNIVQHPTLAVPFLSGSLLIGCNGTTGFQQFTPGGKTFSFPNVKHGDISFNINHPDSKISGVFTFLVDPSCSTGWIAAFDPVSQILIGYVWNREDYPWIHIWQHFENNTIQFVGLEFGTAALHQPVESLHPDQHKIFDTPSFQYLDAGGRCTKSYTGFISTISDEVLEINNIEWDAGKHISITYNGSLQKQVN